MISISDVTISYNDKEGLAKTLDSLFSQQLGREDINLQILVIDGASNDGTKELLESYTEQISNNLIKIDGRIDFSYICEPDDGIYDAMNKGIRFSNGEWIFFLNSGDYLCSRTTLSDFFNAAIASDAINKDIIYGDSYRIYRNRSVVKYADNLSTIVKGLPFSHQSVFTRTELFYNRYYDVSYKISGDYEWFLGAYVQRRLFAYVPICVSAFNTEGLSSKHVYENYLEAEKVRKKYNLKDVLLVRLLKRVIWYLIDKVSISSRWVETMNSVVTRFRK